MKRLALLALLACGPAWAAITDNLELRLQLDEGAGTSAADEAGNWTCTLESESWVNDATHGNVYVSQADQSLNCGTGSIGGAQMSFGAFLYPTTSDSTDYWLSKYSTTTDGRSFRLHQPSSGATTFQVSSDGEDNEIQTITDNQLPDDEWSCVIVTYDAGDVEFYVDGANATEDGDFAITSIFDSTTNSNLIIGNWTSASSSGFEGRMREVVIWAQVLDASERSDYCNDAWEPVDGGFIIINRRNSENPFEQ